MRGVAIKITGMVSVFVLVATSVVLLVQNSKMRRLTRQLLAARVYPYPLASLNFATPETKVVREESATSGAPEKYLILLSMDGCRACQRNMEHWANTTRSLRSEDHVEVWLMSFGPSVKTRTIVSDLTNRHIAFKVMEITDPLMFTLKTGLMATPTTLVLDKEKRLLLELSGQMDQPVESQFRLVLHECPGTNAHNPYLRPGPEEPIAPLKGQAKSKPVALGPCARNGEVGVPCGATLE